ncbi:hypothetical protein [Streptomyces sp. NPDC002644]
MGPTGAIGVLAACATITPDLAGHVAAVSYGHDKGLLTVCLVSLAWAT